MLRNDEKPRTALCPHEFPEVSRHGCLIVRHEDAAIACRTDKDFPVVEAGQPAAVAVLKSMAGTRLNTDDAMNWFKSASAWKRIGIQLVSGVCFLASESF